MKKLVCWIVRSPTGYDMYKSLATAKERSYSQDCGFLGWNCEREWERLTGIRMKYGDPPQRIEITFRVMDKKPRRKA
jgi:hypothetical protein